MAQKQTHQRKTSGPVTGVRRAGTWLLLITFGVLALAPQGGFVLCWSEDGHLAIEPQHAESEHQCDQDAHDDDARHDCEAPSDCCAHSQDTLAGAGECECTDLPLLDLTVALSGSKLKLLLSAVLQRATTPTIAADLARGSSSAGRYDSAERGAHIASQRLEILRSVFLRL
ncbi:MAG: hypothetical protein ACKVX7_00745 [Planctomycetota bacterium]